MSAKSAINKDIFTPRDEKMLAAVQVRRRTKKKIPFLATGGQGEYMTYICLSVSSVIFHCKNFLNKMRGATVSNQCPRQKEGKKESKAKALPTIAVQKASQALNERQERLGRAEEKTGELMNSAQQFADTAHKVSVARGL
uniref:Syntaxin binding protein 6 (amisyn), like n=1 Tax=Scleropages formosus TaxID=113540 RepID=A0A8C9W8W8_SCLFO